MDSLKLFLKENKIKKENEFYEATKSLTDDEGKPLLWEIRHISTKEDERIREECIRNNPSRGARIDYSLYLKKLMAASVVCPPLYNAELQDSYGVKTPEDLICALLDEPGEYQRFARFIQKINGFDVTVTERVERAKN